MSQARPRRMFPRRRQWVPEVVAPGLGEPSGRAVPPDREGAGPAAVARALVWAEARAPAGARERAE